MRYESTALRCAFTVLVCAPVMAASSPDIQNDKKASLSLKASPNVGFSPARIVLTAEVKGGPNDAEDLYCASIEWVWGDDTKSESKADCEPVRSRQERDQAALHARPRLPDRRPIQGGVLPQTEEQARPRRTDDHHDPPGSSGYRTVRKDEGRRTKEEGIKKFACLPSPFVPSSFPFFLQVDRRRFAVDDPIGSEVRLIPGEGHNQPHEFRIVRLDNVSR